MTAPRVAIGVSAAVLLALAVSCGGGKKVESVTTSPSAATPTSAAPSGTLTVVPPSGALGTVFMFKAAGFQPGESVKFTITRPAGTTFTGPPHVATASGTVSTTYRPTAAGHYTIDTSGDKGGRASGAFDVGPAPARTSAPRHAAPVRTLTPKPTAKPAAEPTATPYHY